ncbi:MAG: T9SS type B sorting domain-containing protein [Bacteroidales bacterium]|nr:T9SS type B sorting domain-containing protein [Bacteroidales bacterium]
MRRLLIILFLMLAHVAICQPPLYEHRGVQYATHGNDFWFCLPRTATAMSVPHACLYIMAEHNCTVTIHNPILDYTYTKRIIGCHEINSRLDTLNLIELPAEMVFFQDTIAHNGVPPADQPVTQPQARAFHITSTDTICVYLFSYAMGAIDVTCLLPTEMLRDEYVVQLYPEHAYKVMDDTTLGFVMNDFSMFQVVATEDNTVVDITLSDQDWLGRPKDSVVTVTLNRGMMYNVKVGDWLTKFPTRGLSNDSVFWESVGPIPLPPHMFADNPVVSPFYLDSCQIDLSGTYIKARDYKRIAVFQGSPYAIVGGMGSSDFMFEQAMPIRYAGTEFVVPNLVASRYDFIQFTGLVDGTAITILNPADPTLPTRTLTLDARESDWFLMDTNEGPFYITSTHPILTSVSSCGSLFLRRPPSFMARGDPATLVVVPVEWWHNGSVNGSPVYWVDENRNGWSYYHSTHIFTRTADIGGMYFDRFPIDTMFRPIPGTPYSYAYVHYFADPYSLRKAHLIENRRGGPFWVVADAEKDAEHAIYSYAHLQHSKNYLELNGMPVDQIPEDRFWCVYDSIQFHGWVERPADSIIWDFGDGNVERYRYEDGQWVTHLYADTGHYVINRIIKYMDEALDSNWGYVACKSVFTRPPDTLSAHVWMRIHYDTSISVASCEGAFTFRGHVLETTDTHYITTFLTPSGCDTLWQIDLVVCPHCSSYFDTVLDIMLPWVYNGVSFGDEVSHYPVHVDIGDECDSIIDYSLTIILTHHDPPHDTIPADSIFVLAPNVVTPDGDIDINRRFHLFCSDDVMAAEVYIFDRMGRRLAHFNGLKEDWDCTYNGKPLPQASYVYYVRYIDGSNINWKTMAGTFTIIR